MSTKTILNFKQEISSKKFSISEQQIIENSKVLEPNIASIIWSVICRKFRRGHAGLKRLNFEYIEVKVCKGFKNQYPHEEYTFYEFTVFKYPDY